MNNKDKKFTFVIVGGGTAGVMAATYIKSYWGAHVDVVQVFDHSKPSIGVGESLTPMIYEYLSYVGISTDEVIKNANATFKLGVKFKNWLGDNQPDTHFYSSFGEEKIPEYLYGSVYDIINGNGEYIFTSQLYDPRMHESHLIPQDINHKPHAFHIDATLFTKFISEKFKDQYIVIDGVVKQVILNDKAEISTLILNDGKEITGDFFIDASGFQRVLFKNLNVEWVDKTDWSPLDSVIPCQVPCTFKFQPNYTTAEATEQGWVFQVPLANRWGTGYLYSSKFISDEEAKKNFSKFLLLNYNKELDSDKILRFKSGYWREQWKGNCISVGLASGFSEPLEATNIHQTVVQLKKFVDLFNLTPCTFNTKKYNKQIVDILEEIYLYLRFCYTTGRTDSEFWKYMTNNIPDEVREMEEKIKNDCLNVTSLWGSTVFNPISYLAVSYGLGKIDRNIYQQSLLNRSAELLGKKQYEDIYLQKQRTLAFSVDHKSYIDNVKLRS